MKSTADLTIIVPVYNRADIVCRTLDSIVSQTLPPRKLVIVDNNSTDESLETVKLWKETQTDWPTEIVICEEMKAGACAARNRGLREVQTTYTQFFDSDDTMNPELVETVFRELEKDADIDLVVWRVEKIENGKTRELKFIPTNLLINHIHHALLSTQRCLAKTELFVKAGGWNESLRIWNDWELSVRVLLNAHKIRLIPKVLVTVYYQKESITGESYSSRAGLPEVATAAVLDDLEKAGECLKIRAHAAMTYAILAGNYVREGHPEYAPATLQKALEYPALSKRQKLAMRLAYKWTSWGLRGAAQLFGRML